jgi:FkbM family methyltransferase
MKKKQNLAPQNTAMFQEILRRVRQKYYKWTERRVRVSVDHSIPAERLGSIYGGWIIPANFFHPDSVCYLVGAGEDVSFDLALAHHFGCRVHIFDPTPRAIAHVQGLREHLQQGLPTACATEKNGFYPEYPPQLADLLEMHPIGIWKEDTTLRFFAPPNDAYVSHSLVNLQQSDRFIEVPVRRLAAVMQDLGHTRLDLLKIDIEGAEYEVLHDMLESGIRPRVLCIEFDESAAHHFDGKYILRIENMLQNLENAGYRVIAKEKDCHNYSLATNY